MADFLRGLVRNLERHCTVLRDRLAALNVEPEVQAHVLDAYQRVERVRRQAEQLLADPTLGVAAFLPNHLRAVRELERRATLVEFYLLPFAERFADSDRRLTRLCNRLVQQVRWPLPPPLVVAFSNQYYWTLAGFPLICAPAAEADTLLRLPDLCHELGHKLLERHAAVADRFLPDVVDYVDREKRRVATGQRPSEYQLLYDQLLANWLDRWVLEFGADMIATYLLGGAFGWQHVRLCAGHGTEVFRPTLGEAAEHPADEARLRGILAVLEQTGAATAGVTLRSVWQRYVSSPANTPPADYGLAYPQALIESLAGYVVDECRQLGVRGFDEIAEPVDDIAALIAEAWDRFVTDPDLYNPWEQSRLEALWQELGC